VKQLDWVIHPEIASNRISGRKGYVVDESMVDNIIMFDVSAVRLVNLAQVELMLPV